MRILQNLLFAGLALVTPLSVMAAKRTYPASDGGVVSVKITTVAVQPSGRRSITSTFVNDIPSYYKSAGLAVPPVAHSVTSECDDDDTGGGSGGDSAGSEGGTGSGTGSASDPVALPAVDVVPDEPPASTPGTVTSFTGTWSYSDGFSVTKTWTRGIGNNGSQTPWHLASYKVTPPPGRNKNGTQDCDDED